MKIVFASNYFNHHEKYFCDELLRIPDVEFYFIQTHPVPQESLDCGYPDIAMQLPYCICSHLNQESYDRAIELSNNADVLILGGAPFEFVKYRAKRNKITFYYAERIFRQGIWHLLNPKTLVSVIERYIIPGQNSRFYLLAASAYTTYDMERIFSFRNRQFKWGHFVNIDPVNKSRESGKVRLLWVGRYIKLKHPEYAIKLAITLRKIGYSFEMDMIGLGELKPLLEKEVYKNHLEECVIIHDPVSPREVREYMGRSDIFLFTSDFNEGWGAVLGEAMASGCAVVTSHACGASPFLVQHKKNGLLFESGNYASFERSVLKLMDNSNLRDVYSVEAEQTMNNLWNPHTAAQRIYSLSKSILEGKDIVSYNEGPISKAEILKNNWFKDDTI